MRPVPPSHSVRPVSPVRPVPPTFRGSLNLDELSDAEIMVRALQMWQNLIESGDPILSAKDLENTGNAPKALEKEQMRFILRIEDLIKKVRRNIKT